MYNKFPQFYNKIFDYSLKKGTHVKLIDIIRSSKIKDNNRIILSTKHLYKELPIRLANRVTDLNNLPFGLSKNHSINTVREWYLTSFLELLETKEPNSTNEIIEYKNLLNKIYNRHSTILMTISKGLIELKKENKIGDLEAPTMQLFLNRFYTNRTEIRILIEQYLSFFGKPKGENYFGIVNLKSEPGKIIHSVMEDIQFLCNKNKLNVELNDIVKINLSKNNIILPCIDHYLYYILFELVKNSIQATIEKKCLIHNYVPKIELSVIEIDENWIVIKIEDNGIGIQEQNMNKIWYYSFTTSAIDSNDIVEVTDFNKSSPLSGFGYGLPISDIYINFFNSSANNIKIDSIYKKGTTIYLYLRNHKL
jgi:pyruvate dehydrogenase kinase 2/3/4